MTKPAKLVKAETLPLANAPDNIIQAATSQATALAKLIEDRKLFSMISGKKYVRVEGWVPLARMNNVIPREIANDRQQDGSYVARVQLVRLDDGMVLTEASAECGGPNEQLWNKRAPYARRSMAATRATGKACRLAFSWIVALAGYEATPAEEMDFQDTTFTEEEPHVTDEEVNKIKFDSDEPASVSNYKGKWNLWIYLNGTFDEDFANRHSFRQSKNPDSWFKTWDKETALLVQQVIREEKNHG